jgi:ABC-type dipeptide/oligopeptide/nickel transport system ATPase component
MSGPVLSLRGLSVSFPGTGGGRERAVDDLSLDLHPGTLTALVGESGSGKSVSALSVLGLLPMPPASIDAGAVVYADTRGDQTDLIGASARVLRRVRGGEIAMIFQEPMTSLNPVLTVGSQIIEAVRLHRRMASRDARAIALEAMERVGIPEAPRRLAQYPHEFSGGMRQRVMIAIALACEPRVLIADEPTTALDVTIQKTILDLIRGLVEDEGLSVLLITHDLALVSEYADRVAVLYRGYLLEEGSADRVIRSPVHPYTRGLLATVPDPGERRRRLATLGSLLEREGARPIGVGDRAARAWTPGLEPGGTGHRMLALSADHAVRVAGADT